MVKRARVLSPKKRSARQGKSGRLSQKERREDILQRSIFIFSKKGFSSTTTKEIAKGLGLSEALLFKHFRTKDQLIREIEDQVQIQMDQIFLNILRRPASAETLAFAIAFNLFVLSDGLGFSKEKSILDRLVVFDLLERGRFFKHTNEKNLPKYFKFLRLCMDDGVRRGLLHDDGGPIENKLWCCHHVAGFMGLAKHSKAIDYVGEANTINQDAIRFCLKAVGFHGDAVSEFSDPSWILDQMNHV